MYQLCITYIQHLRFVVYSSLQNSLPFSKRLTCQTNLFNQIANGHLIKNESFWISQSSTISLSNDWIILIKLNLLYYSAIWMMKLLSKLVLMEIMMKLMSNSNSKSSNPVLCNLLYKPAIILIFQTWFCCRSPQLCLFACW